VLATFLVITRVRVMVFAFAVSVTVSRGSGAERATGRNDRAVSTAPTTSMTAIKVAAAGQMILPIGILLSLPFTIDVWRGRAEYSTHDGVRRME
jgi:hypothetical protein